MRFQNKRFDQVTPDDIQGLIDNRVTESLVLEYKARLPDTRDEAAKEKVVRSIVAMTNAEGGVILFGVDESNENGEKMGYAVRVHDLGESRDEATRRLMSTLSAKTDPPIRSQIGIHEVQMSDGRRILVMGVARSLFGPHCETYRELIPRRGDGQNYNPRPAELRRMFLESETMLEECEQFVGKRLARLKTVPLEKSQYVAVHVLPIGRLREQIDVRAAHDSSRGAFPPLGKTGGVDIRFNSEGFVAEGRSYANRKLINSRTQVFRFGGMEGVNCDFVVDLKDEHGGPLQILHAPHASQRIREYIRRGIVNLTQYSISTAPFFLSLVLENVRGVYMQGTDSHNYGDSIDVDTVQANAIVEDLRDVTSACASLTRVMWQAGGFPDDWSAADS